jgi:hypothetical protein
MGQVIYFFSNMSRLLLEPTQLPVQYVQGGGSFPDNKWAGIEGDHTHTSDAEVKNGWNYT